MASSKMPASQASSSTEAGAPFSPNVEFPTASISFLDGTEITLRPKSDSHDILGVNYALDVRKPDGSQVTLGVKFCSHGQLDQRKHWIEVAADHGMPLEIRGPNHSFKFQGAWPSFYPNCEYRLTGLSGKGYSVEVDKLDSFKLYYVPPKQRGEH